MMRRVRWVYTALGCVMIALYRAIPDARVLIVAFVGALSCAAVCTGCMIQRPARRSAWLLIGTGMLIIVAGELGDNAMAVGGAGRDFPSVPDLFYLLAHLPLAVGLLWLALPRVAAQDWAGMIETAALSLGGSLVLWIMLVRPPIRGEVVTGFDEAILIARWVGDVIVIVAVLRLVIGWPRYAASWLLALAGVVLVVGDIRYGMAIRSGTWHTGGQVDAGVLAFVGLIGLAALMPSMARIGSYREAGHPSAFAGLTALALALMVAPTVLLTEMPTNLIVVSVAIIGAAIGMLVILRLFLAVSAHRRTIARDAVLRQAARSIGLAMNPADVTASLATAFADMAGTAATSVRLAPAEVAVRNDVTHLRVPAPDMIDGDPQCDIVYTAPAATLSGLEDELGILATQAGIALQRIALTERVRVSEREQHALAYRATHDGLTGLANAELFRGDLRNARHTVEPGRMTAVLFIDLDDFKNINDTLGHEAGDAVLVSTARRIGTCLRATDVGARLGGDEFAVLLRNVADESAAYVVARRLTEVLAQPTMIGDIPVTCRGSVGLATAFELGQYDALLRRADTALYAAKAAGKGRWRPYHPQMQSPLRRGTDLRTELERALHSRSGATGLAMHYQPIVELATGEPAGVEALIRWVHPERGPINVPELIALAEHTGLIVPLGEWVFTEVLRDGGALTAGGCYLSINVSVAQLRLPGFTSRLRDQLRASAIDQERVVIEITESQLVSDNEQIWDDLTGLRTSGVRVAIDDYGTGYASLSYLRQPVIDIVKLDRQFLDDIDSDRARALLRAVLSLSNELKLPLIAEGIEDEGTRESLLDLGCEYGQGHLFAKAMPLNQALAWLAAR